MAILDCIKNRKSIRNYENREISDECIREILEAGILAPSAKNEQNWKFIVVRDDNLRKGMLEACQGQKMIGQAPVTLVVCANNERKMLCGQSTVSVDCSIALSYMMLQASALGLGTCWLGYFSEEKVKNVLNIPEDYRVVAVTPLGYAAREGTTRNRKEFDDIVVVDGF